jgi:hypothetical protein
METKKVANKEKKVLTLLVRKYFALPRLFADFEARLQKSKGGTGRPLFSSFCSAKGLQSGHVLLHKVDIMKHGDENVRYVAVTRSSDDLQWLDVE